MVDIKDVQKEFALETYTMPTTHTGLSNDSEVLNDEVIYRFLEQTRVGTPAPTTRAMSLVYTPLLTAFEQGYSGIASTSAVSGANQELISQIENLQTAEPVEQNKGYRTITVEIETILQIILFMLTMKYILR